MKYGLWVLTVFLLGLSLVDAPHLELQSLQHGPTVVGLLLLALAIRRNWVSTLSVFCMVLFLGLHIIGARYLYSLVPYDDWSTAALGKSLSPKFGWQRNHYDRLVHFCFGGLGLIVVTETALRHGRLRLPGAIGLAILCVSAIGGVYEILEWLLTLVAAPEQAESYNGQQGDLWDAQKDMALALGGAVLMTPLLLVRVAGRRRFVSTRAPGAGPSSGRVEDR